MLSVSTAAMGGLANSHKAQAEEHQRQKRAKIMENEINEARNYFGNISGGYTHQYAAQPKHSDSEIQMRQQLYSKFGIPPQFVQGQQSVPQQQQQQQQQQQPKVENAEEQKPKKSLHLQEVETIASRDPMAAIVASIFKPFEKDERGYRDAVVSTIHLGKVINNMVTNGSQDTSTPFYRRYKPHEIGMGDIPSSWEHYEEEDNQRYYRVAIPTIKRF
jgi:DNA primase